MAPVPIPLTIRSLPSGIVEDILLRLSPKELIRCLCVLKSWNALIRSEQFYKAHLKRSQETKSYRTLVAAKARTDPEQEGTDFFQCAFYGRDTFSNALKIAQPLRHPRRDTEIVGYYDGLVCIRNIYYHRDLAIWNPSIQKFKRIPSAPFEVPAGTKAREPKYGFGYDISNDDYKVVRIVELEIDKRAIVGSEVQVYSLKSNSWKKIESLSCTWSSSRAVSLKGALHWFGKLESPSYGLRVLTLDFEKEIFREFPTPFEVQLAMGLEVLNGKLCIGVFHDLKQHDMWEMNEYGVAESWTHLYTIMEGVVTWTFEYCTPLVLSNNGKRVLFHDESDLTDGNLFWYDTEKNTGKRVQIPGMPSDFRAAICVANLGLLDGDPVIVRRQQQVLPMKRKIASSEGEGSEQAS